MALLDTPDIYGYTLFCEDVRLEASGARTVVGMYTGTMFLQTNFPVTLAKFAFVVTLLQRKTIFNPNIGLRIFMPGDTETASIQAAMK